MKLIKTDDLDDTGLDNLYSFLIKSDNISNKINTNNIIWSIIYLRKIFNKSFKSKRSIKERVKYNYIITHDNKIQCFFSLQYLSKDDDVNIVDLTIIIDKNIIDKNIIDKNYETNILKLILDEFYELSKYTSIGALNILAVYIPVNIQQLNIEINNNIGFELAFQDTTTYQESYNVYYNHYMQVNNANDENYARIQKSKYNEYSKVQIIELLMNQYNVNIIVNPKKEISKKLTQKLTRKSIAILDFKVVTKNIFDIKEIQDLPEYNYDYLKIYLFKNYSFNSYLLNTKKPNIDEFIINRFFKGSIKFNQNIYNLYKTIFTFIYNTINLKIITDSLFNIDYLLKINNFFVYSINSQYYDSIIKKNKLNLIISNSIDTIKYFSFYKIDIIRTKSLVHYIQEIKNLENNIENKIMITNNNNEIKNIMFNNGKKYSFILIENYYPNYDYLISDLSLICKLSSVLYTILNALKYINKGGDLLLSMHFNNFKIPIFNKIFNFILSLFEDFNFDSLIIIRQYLLLKNFKGLNQSNEQILNTLLNIINKYEKEEFDLNDIYNLILSNKFTYKYNTSKKIDKQIITKKIVYDIKGFNPNSNSNIKLKKLINYINTNNTNNINNNFFKKYLDTDTNIEHIYVKIIKQNYILLLKFIEKHKLSSDEDIHGIIKLLSV
jgi:hypothetical protein